jgi:hypothetical protein
VQVTGAMATISQSAHMMQAHAKAHADQMLDMGSFKWNSDQVSAVSSIHNILNVGIDKGMDRELLHYQRRSEPGRSENHRACGAETYLRKCHRTELVSHFSYS